MDMLENQGTQKGRRPSVKVLVLAAALAVGCVLSIAAGLPARVYNFATGGQVYTMPGTGSSYATIGGEVSPITEEDGRLWFTADGEKVDITDKVDENTPYIYERADPATGEKGYVVVGGTAENFGWAEFFIMDGNIYSLKGQYFADYLVELPDGSKVSLFDLTDEQRNQVTVNPEPGEDNDGEDNDALDLGSIPFQSVNRPWFQAALDQLGLAD